jgi:hypothetical protein
MSDLRDAARQALEFVTSKQWGTTPYMDVRVYEDAARLRDTLRAALEQPEQDTDCHAQGICQRSGYGIGQPEQVVPYAVWRQGFDAVRKYKENNHD